MKGNKFMFTSIGVFVVGGLISMYNQWRSDLGSWMVIGGVLGVIADNIIWRVRSMTR